MTILQIQAYPELQDIARHTGDNQAAAARPLFSDTSTGAAAAKGNNGAALGQSQGIAGMINTLQQHVETNLNIVRDPPFFPIATYQRQDLIKRIRIVEEAVQRASLDKNFNPGFAAEGLSQRDLATDKEISSALDKLFALRDQLMNNPSASPAEIAPGSILAVEV